MLEQIWKPDTYFLNGKESYLHAIPTSNRLVRLSRDGSILFSSRLTVKAACPMNLRDFPLDKQVNFVLYQLYQVIFFFFKILLRFLLDVSPMGG